MHGEFHEDCVCRMLKDLRTLMNPKYIKVTGKFMPRGGISFCPTAEWDMVFASQYDTVITNPPDNPVPDPDYVIPS